MNPRRSTAALALAVCLMHTAGAFAQAPVLDVRTLDERLKRLERVQDSTGLFKLHEEVKSLGIEVRRLQGLLEEQAHAINQLKQSQRVQYGDVDQRLQRIESAAPAQAASPPPRPAATPAAQAASTGAEASPPAPAAPATATTPSTQAPATAAGVDPFAEQQAYQSAFGLLKSGRYEDAAAAFKQFIAEFSAGSYSHAARVYRETDVW